MDFSDNQRCSMNTLLYTLEGSAITVTKDAPCYMETIQIQIRFYLSQENQSLVTVEFINFGKLFIPNLNLH